MSHSAKLIQTAGISLLLTINGSALADNLKVGALMPLTGGLQAYGESCVNGMRMATDEANAAGGVTGKQVEVITADTQTKAQPSIDAAKKLVSISQVAGIVGALSSGNTMPVAQSISSTEGVPQISPASTAPTITTLEDNDYLFRTVPSDAFQGVGLAQVVKQQGTDKVAVLYVNNDYGSGLADSFSSSFTGSVTSSAAFEPGQASYRGELLAAAKGEPQALLLIAYPDDGGIIILKQALEEELFSKFIFTDGMKAEKVIEQIGADLLEGAYGTSPKALESDASQAFKTLYEKKYGELPPRPFIDASYDATAILLLATARAGSNDGSAIRDAMREVTNAPGSKINPGELAKGLELAASGEDIDYVGAAGNHEFDDQGDVSGTFEHWKISKGKLETVTVFKPE